MGSIRTFIERLARARVVAGLLAAGCLAALVIGLAPERSEGARAMEAGEVADRLVARLATQHPEDLSARCSAVGRRTARRVLFSCTWRGSRPVGDDGIRRCRGRSRAVGRASGAVRFRTLRRSCRLAERPRRELLGFSDNAWLDHTLEVGAAQEASLVAAAGATSHRVFMDWRHLEPNRDRWNEDVWEIYREFYAELTKRGIRPLITVGFAPPWSWGAVSGVCAVDCRRPPARAHDGEWVEFVGEVARRFPRAIGIEIWNEPNINSFWIDPDPRRYAELVALARRAIDAIDPRLTLVGGALGNVRTATRGDVTTGEFLDAAYAHGLDDSIDVLSLHSYPFGSDLGPGSLFASPFEAVDAVLRARSDRSRELWVTELGVSTSDPRPQYRFDEQQQAHLLVRAIEDARARPGVRAVFVHNLVDAPRYRPDTEPYGYGVMRAGDPPTPKPAYCALATLAGGHAASTC